MCSRHPAHGRPTSGSADVESPASSYTYAFSCMSLLVAATARAKYERIPQALIFLLGSCRLSDSARAFVPPRWAKALVIQVRAADSGWWAAPHDRSDQMSHVPTVLVPGMLCSPRLYAEQLPALWRFGPVSVASHLFDDKLAVIADEILATAPPQFGLVGLSMGGYLAFEIMRQAGHRVTRLALLNTTAHPDTAEQTQRRLGQIALAQDGRFAEVVDALYERWVPAGRRRDLTLQRVIRQMADETGPEAFVRQQTAIMNRPDSRIGLGAIGCPTLVVAGADDEVTIPDHAAEMADRIPRARLVVIPECGHLSTLEQPVAVRQVLVDWLTELAGVPDHAG